MIKIKNSILGVGLAFASLTTFTGCIDETQPTAEIRLSDQNVKLITFGRADQFQAIDQKLRKRQ